MRRRPATLHSVLVAAVFGAIACAQGGEAAKPSLPDPSTFPSASAFFEGMPASEDLPSEGTRADEVLPVRFSLVAQQSPVRNQGSERLCTAYTSLGLMEAILIAQGADPAPNLSEVSLTHTLGTFVAPGEFHGWASKTAFFGLSHYGVVDSTAWPNPSVIGDDPGEPPAAVATATRYYVAEGHLINHTDNSIKAFLFHHGLPVDSGVNYYAHAWNTDTPSRAYAGIVNTPLPEDVSYAIAHPGTQVAHAFLIVGWDDEMTSTRLRANGRTLKDANGDPIVDRGFYLFKNSFGTDGWGRDNSEAPGYGWISYSYVAEHGGAWVTTEARTDAPYVEICDDGVDNDLDSLVDCRDRECRTLPVCTVPDGGVGPAPDAGVPNGDAG